MPESPPVVDPLTATVRLPSGEKSWDEFLTKYARGEMVACNFTDGIPIPLDVTSTSLKSPSLSQTRASPATSPRIPFITPPQPSQTATTPLSPTRPALEHFPSSDSTRVRLESHDGYCPDSDAESSAISTPSVDRNQDPDIPDMVPTETPNDPKRFFRQRVEDDPAQEEGLTRENMKNLDHDQEVDMDKAPTRSKGSKGKDPVEATGAGPKRRGMRAELASVNDETSPHDSMSSPDEGVGVKRPFVKRPNPRSRGSYISRRAGSASHSVDRSRSVVGDLLAGSASGTSASSGKSHEIEYDPAADRQRVREFFEKFGYMPAPRQAPDATRRRLRVIRRLGLDAPSEIHKETMDRFTRLAVGIFKTKIALVSIVGNEKQTFLSEIGFGRANTEVDMSLCAHSIVGTGQDCLIVPDASKDWRFAKNPLVDEGRGELQFYAGAPLRFGSGARAAIIGSLCVIDDKPRDFSESDRKVLSDLAVCVVSELELMYSQQASVDSAKLHQISVEFLRRSLKTRPTQRAGSSEKPGSGETGSQPSEGKRITGKDSGVASANVDIYDEACREIRFALDAYAVAVVELSQFHLFYPAYQSSSTAGTSTRGGRTGTHSGTNRTGTASMGGSTVYGGGQSTGPPTIYGGHASLASETGTVRHGSLGGSSGDTVKPDGSVPSGEATAGSRSSGRNNSARSVNDGSIDEPEAYSKSVNIKVARKTYAVTDPTAPSRTPQVLFIPNRQTSNHKSKSAAYKGDVPGKQTADNQLNVLGYSCANDGFAFNFTSSPAARKIISDFIASNVKTRKVWYTRDDSEGIAQSINHLMPPGTETSMAMPVFGFNGQVAFAVVACWTDPLYTYPAGAMQFVETIAGSLLASVMKERLHQVERSQLTFAAAASHELRTPLHQINAAATLLRSTLSLSLNSPLSQTPALFRSPDTSPTLDQNAPTLQLEPRISSLSTEDRQDALSQLEIIEANGLALKNILENIIDTLDIGRMTNRAEEKAEMEHEVQLMSNFTAQPDVSHVPTTDEKMNTPAIPIAARSGAKNKDKGKEDRGTTDLRDVLEKVVEDCLNLENKSRRVAGRAGLDEVEVILEVLPRNRGGWLMDDDPGPLSRAVQKIVHNACKFTEKGHVHITVQDVSRDVVLPGGYDNSIKVSTVFIDVKDSGRGMTPDFLESEVLRPFTKADPFMPGSGLGLGLAQRMIEILGGKLAIASTLNKGTLVHIEIPLHLLNRDAESDESQIEDFANDANARADKRAFGSGEDESSGQDSRGGIREDGIYLAGFDISRSKDSGVRRVGKSLLRQLKLNFCRVVTEISYASLIIAPDVLEETVLMGLYQKARQGTQVIVLEREGANGKCGKLEEMIGMIPVRRLSRPLRPSVLRRVMRPPKNRVELREVYQSAVVGGLGPSGDEGQDSTGGEGIGEPGFARVRPIIGTSSGVSRSGSTSASVGSRSMTGTNTDDALLPSPPLSPAEDLGDFKRLSLEISRPSDSDEDWKANRKVLGLELEGVPPIRPVMGGHNATDPLPLAEIREKFDREEAQGRQRIRIGHSADDSTPSDDSELNKIVDDGGDSAQIDTLRPAIHERNTEPIDIVASPPSAKVPGDPLRVLVVEDNVVNRKILITMLKRTACHYAEAVDGGEAVQRFKSFRPDLVLLDINMPRKDGFAAATEMRAFERRHNSERRAKIIAVTAMGGEAARRRGLAECGIDEWKTKPVGIKDLKQDVERLKTL